MTKEAYAAALQGVFECCQQDNKTSVLDTLQGVIVDWATAQIEGLKAALGEEKAEQLLRGCQVYITIYYAYIHTRNISTLGYAHKYNTMLLK